MKSTLPCQRLCYGDKLVTNALCVMHEEKDGKKYLDKTAILKMTFRSNEKEDADV